MSKVFSLVLVVGLVAALSGCAGQNSTDKTNQMISESNDGRLESFARAMAVCGDNAACQVAISLAFAGNMGQQQFLRPESWLDYVREARQWIDPVGNLIDRLNGGTGGISGDRAASVIKGDNNLVMIGNRARADNQSSMSFSLNPNYTRSWNGYNRDFKGQQPINDDGLGEVVQ